MSVRTTREPHVLFEDADLLAVDKPAGVVTHPAYRHPDGTLFDAIVARQVARGERRPWLLHRLDRDTSGVVLLAKTEHARKHLVRQFERRLVRKWYLAVVRGTPDVSAGAICAPLRRDPADRRRVIVDPTGQAATTSYSVLAAYEDTALVLAEPRTGRTHQIRAHLASRGHPIVGDSTYGGDDERLDLTSAGEHRHLLHAWRLRVSHPASGDALRIEAPVPADFVATAPDGWFAAQVAMLTITEWEE